VVVGTERGRQFQKSGFVSRDGQLVYLNSLIPRNRGWEIYTAGAINSKGQIAGTAVDFDNNYHVVLLTPQKPKSSQ